MRELPGSAANGYRLANRIGCNLATDSNVFAAPLGSQVPRSHLRTVANETLRNPAKSSWVRFNPRRPSRPDRKHRHPQSPEDRRSAVSGDINPHSVRVDPVESRIGQHPHPSHIVLGNFPCFS